MAVPSYDAWERAYLRQAPGTSSDKIRADYESRYGATEVPLSTEIGRSLQRGLGLGQRAVGGTLHWAGAEDLGENIFTAGIKRMEENPRSAGIPKFMEDPLDAVTSARFWAAGMPETGASVVPPLLLGAIGGPVGYGLGMAAGGLMEGMGGTYVDQLRAGVDESLARKQGLAQSGAVAALSALPISRMLKPGSAAGRFVGTGTAEALTETAEGGTEAAITGKPILEGLKEEAEVAPLAFVMGGGMGVLGGKSDQPGGAGDQDALTILRQLKGQQDKPGDSVVARDDGEWTLSGDELIEPTSDIHRQQIFHGSGHRYARPNLANVFSGEGVNAFGWGWYSAERRGVAESYRTQGMKEEDFLPFRVSDAKVNDIDHQFKYDPNWERTAVVGDIEAEEGVLEPTDSDWANYLLTNAATNATKWNRKARNIPKSELQDQLRLEKEVAIGKMGEYLQQLKSDVNDIDSGADDSYFEVMNILGEGTGFIQRGVMRRSAEELKEGLRAKLQNQIRQVNTSLRSLMAFDPTNVDANVVPNEGAEGYLYQAEIPDPVVDEMLDWDNEVSWQPKVLQKLGGDAFVEAANQMIADNPGKLTKARDVRDMTGAQLYKFIANAIDAGKLDAPTEDIQIRRQGKKGESMNPWHRASMYLRDRGIPGQMYYDGGSRNPIPQGLFKSEKRTRNHVIWDQDVLDTITLQDAERGKIYRQRIQMRVPKFGGGEKKVEVLKNPSYPELKAWLSGLSMELSEEEKGDTGTASVRISKDAKGDTYVYYGPLHSQIRAGLGEVVSEGRLGLAQMQENMRKGYPLGYKNALTLRNEDLVKPIRISDLPTYKTGEKKGQIKNLDVTIDELNDIAGEVTSEIVDYMWDEPREAEEAMRWYDDAGGLIRRLAPDPAMREKLVRIVALASRNTGIQNNMNLTIDAMHELLLESQVHRSLPLTGSVEDALNAEVFDTKQRGVGMKVMNFYQNLHDAAFNRNDYPEAVTVDRWVMRAFGMEKDQPNLSEYRALSALVVEVAESLSLKPSDVQALLWMKYRGSLEGGANTFWEAYRRKSEEIMFETNGNIPDSLWKALTPLQQEHFTQDAVSLIKDREGNDMLAKAIIGEQALAFTEGTLGSWLKQFSEGALTTLNIKKTGNNAIDSQVGELYAAAIGHIYAQDAVFRMQPNPRGKETAVSIKFPIPVDVEAMSTENWLPPEIESYTVRQSPDGTTEVIFALGEVTPGFDKDRLFGEIDTAARRFMKMGKNHAGVFTTLQMPFRHYQMKEFKYDGGLVMPEGDSVEQKREGYRQIFRERGRPDLLELVDDLATQYDTLTKSLAQKERLELDFGKTWFQEGFEGAEDLNLMRPTREEAKAFEREIQKLHEKGFPAHVLPTLYGGYYLHKTGTGGFFTETGTGPDPVLSIDQYWLRRTDMDPKTDEERWQRAQARVTIAHEAAHALDAHYGWMSDVGYRILPSDDDLATGYLDLQEEFDGGLGDALLEAVESARSGDAASLTHIMTSLLGPVAGEWGVAQQLVGSFPKDASRRLSESTLGHPGDDAIFKVVLLLKRYFDVYGAVKSGQLSWVQAVEDGYALPSWQFGFALPARERHFIATEIFAQAHALRMVDLPETQWMRGILPESIRMIDDVYQGIEISKADPVAGRESIRKAFRVGEYGVPDAVGAGADGPGGYSTSIVSRSQVGQAPPGDEGRRGDEPAQPEGGARRELGSAPYRRPERIKSGGGDYSTKVWGEVDDESLQIIEGIYDQFGSEINRQRRDTRSWDTTERAAFDEIAKATGVDLAKLINRPPGSTVNAEQMLAYAMMLANSVQEIKNRAVDVRNNYSDEGAVDLYAEMQKLALLQAPFAGYATEAGRALNILRKSATVLGEVSALAETVNDANKLQLREMVERIADAQDKNELLGQSRAMAKHNAFDYAYEWWINGLLSGPRTHAVNILSNALYGALEQANAFTAAMLPGSYTMREALARLRGLLHGTQLAASNGIKAFKENAPQLDPSQKLEHVQYGATPGRVGDVVRLPGRLLTAEDEFFKGFAYSAKFAEVAMSEAIKQSRETGAPVEQIYEEIMSNPDDFPEMNTAAIEHANQLTFTTRLGPIMGSLNSVLRRSGIGKVIVPFVRTPTNIVKSALSYTPIAPLFRNIREQLSGKRGEKEKSLATARMVLGSGIGATVMMAAAEGLLTGAGPDDPGERELLRRNGWEPYSVKMGDKWVKYNRFEPVGMILGMAADANEIWHYSTGPDRDKLASLIIGSLATNLADKTFMKGISDVVAFLNDPQRYGKRYLQSLAGSMVPSVVGQFAYSQDPYMREAESIIDGVKTRIPGKREELAKRVGVSGEPYESSIWPRGFYGSPLNAKDRKVDPVADAMLRTGLIKRKPSRTQFGVKLDAFEYNDFAEHMGKARWSALGRIVNNPSFDRIPQQIQHSMLEKAWDDASRVARMQWLMKNPSVLQRSKEKKGEAAVGSRYLERTEER